MWSAVERGADWCLGCACLVYLRATLVAVGAAAVHCACGVLSVSCKGRSDLNVWLYLLCMLLLQSLHLRLKLLHVAESALASLATACTSVAVPASVQSSPGHAVDFEESAFASQAPACTSAPLPHVPAPAVPCPLPVVGFPEFSLASQAPPCTAAALLSSAPALA